MSKNIVRAPRSRFLHVMCKKCKNEQVIYNKISTRVVCAGCGEEIAAPMGGEARITAKILETLN
jgi:small subunit ribosomal protein S27e